MGFLYRVQHPLSFEFFSNWERKNYPNKNLLKGEKMEETSDRARQEGSVSQGGQTCNGCRVYRITEYTNSNEKNACWEYNKEYAWPFKFCFLQVYYIYMYQHCNSSLTCTYTTYVNAAQKRSSVCTWWLGCELSRVWGRSLNGSRQEVGQSHCFAPQFWDGY